MLIHCFLLTIALLSTVPTCRAGAYASVILAEVVSSEALEAQERHYSLAAQISQLLGQLDKTELLWVHQILAQQGAGYDLRANKERLSEAGVKGEIAAFLQEGRSDAVLHEALKRARDGVGAMDLKRAIEPLLDLADREALFNMYCVMWRWHNLAAGHYDDATWRRLVRELLAGRNSNQELQQVLAMARGE